MNKKVLLIILFAAILTACFIPFTLQKSVLIRYSFLNTYSFLSKPVKWEQWRPEFRKVMNTDSDKIIIHRDSSRFTIKYDSLELGVMPKGNSFDISELLNGHSTNYSYELIPVPDKFLNKTIVYITQKTNTLNYLIGKFEQPAFLDENLNSLKNFIETDSLLYGFNIFKTGVPENTLIVMEKEVLEKDEFTEGAKMLATLKQYIKTNNIKQMYPVIAQFNQDIKDSVHVKVGFYINKEVKSGNGIEFTHMPKGGLLLAAKFKGEFSKRGKVYAAVKQYFSDHSNQMVLLPFETYLDNKLPINDKDTINIQVNFGTFPSGTGSAK